MLVYYREITVEWGESDPFGLVYFPRMLAWFNDAEHEFFAQAGYPVKQMVEQDRTARAIAVDAIAASPHLFLYGGWLRGRPYARPRFTPFVLPGFYGQILLEAEQRWLSLEEVPDTTRAL